MESVLNFWLGLTLSPPVIVTALALGTLGEVAKRAVNAKKGSSGWRGVYYVTLPAHPVLLGALLGFVPVLPVAIPLAVEGYDGAARFATYLYAGIVCKVAYDLLVSTLRRALGQKAAREEDGSSSGSGSDTASSDSDDEVPPHS